VASIALFSCAQEAPATREVTLRSAVANVPSAAASVAPIDTRPQHLVTQAQLFELVPPFDPKHQRFLEKHIDVGGFGAMNHGNPKIARHTISRAQCLKGLQGITLQTPEQRQICGHDNMVPISDAVCIDIFEFPNRACELPFVWVGATIGNEVCKRLGKRLCT